MNPMRALGTVLILAGLVLAIVPSLVTDPAPTTDVFEMVERRIPFGGLCGLGLLFFFHAPRVHPLHRIAAAVLWLTIGVLVARTVGLVLDGMHTRQIMWWAVEAAVAAVAAFYLKRAAPDSAGARS